MSFLKKHAWWFLTLGVFVVLVFFIISERNGESPTTVRTEIGTVTSYISVSGTAVIDDIIPLSFPRGGTVSGIFVARGDEVTTGSILATVGDTALQAEYAAALAEVTRARAIRDELLTGQTTEESAVTQTTVKNAEDALSSIIRTEASRVETARTTLYNTGLTAIAKNPDTVAPAPVVTGSYTCTAAGTYTLELYDSGTLSGYSYRYSGIETGVGNASTNQSAALGACGLRLQFTANANYTNTVYTISIPNTASQGYAANQAAFEQALAQEESNINAAKRTLELALNQATVATAGTRVEKLIAANAVVAAAEARLSQTAYVLSESAIRAPKDGIISDLDIAIGQTVTTQPIITLFAPTKTTVVARIPEKDIARLEKDQVAEIEFDANPTELFEGSITFLSPVQTTVNGIPYYDAVIEITNPPTWLRPGMQADVRIITQKLTNVIRIPRLYLVDEMISVKVDDKISKMRPTILLIGSDGFVAIEGLSANTEIVLPAH